MDGERYSFLPLRYPELAEYYEILMKSSWTPGEIDYSNDRSDWDKLDENSRKPIEFILAFFAQFDGIVNENLIQNFKRETSKRKEAGFFYAWQEANEVVHNHTYSNLIEALIRDPKKKMEMMNSIRYYPSIQKIAAWSFEWMRSDRPLAERIIAFACIEGMIFQSAFAVIYWIKQRNVLQGLTKANEWIARDEGVHTQFAITLYHVLTTKDKELERVPEGRVHEILGSAVSVSEEMIKTALSSDLVGLNSDDLVLYIKCTADTLASALGYKKPYNVTNPLTWMAVISLPNKSNFFETKVSEYSKVSTSDFTFDLTTEF